MITLSGVRTVYYLNEEKKLAKITGEITIQGDMVTVIPIDNEVISQDQEITVFKSRVIKIVKGAS